MRKIVLALLFCVSSVYAQEKTPQQLLNDARAAYDRKDFAAYLTTMDALATLRPGHPVMLFNRAGALALNGKNAEAVALLDKLARMQIAMDLSDHDLDSLRERDDFRAVEKQMNELRTRKISSPRRLRTTRRRSRFSSAPFASGRSCASMRTASSPTSSRKTSGARTA